MSSIRRILIVASLMPWLSLSTVVAQQHAHESDSADHVAVVHTHFAPHSHSDNEISHRDHDGAELSDVDEHVVWIDEVGVVQAPRSFPPVLLILPAHVEIVPELLVRVAVVADQATLAHGPPRASPSLRAPPFPSL